VIQRPSFLAQVPGFLDHRVGGNPPAPDLSFARFSPESLATGLYRSCTGDNDMYDL